MEKKLFHSNFPKDFKHVTILDNREGQNVKQNYITEIFCFYILASKKISRFWMAIRLKI